MNGFENINVVYDGQLPILFKFFSFLSIFKSRLVIIQRKTINKMKYLITGGKVSWFSFNRKTFKRRVMK